MRGIWIILPSMSLKTATTSILGKTSPLKYSFDLVGPDQPNKKPLVTRTFSDSFKEGSYRGCGRQVISKLLFKTVSNFLVPKPNNQWRPVIELSFLNNFIIIFKFKMDTPEKIRASTEKGHWVFSLDRKNPYFHKPIYSKSQKYLRMECLRNLYQFRVLPFGINMAPWFSQE